MLSALVAGKGPVMSTVDAIGPLKEAQVKWGGQNLKANKEAVGKMEAAENEEVKRYLLARIVAIGSEIDELQKELSKDPSSTKILLPNVMEENGFSVSAEDLKRDPGRFHLLNSLLKPDANRIHHNSDQRTNKTGTIFLDQGKN